ncbi:MAG: DUF3108 domain-containing protein [Balneolaceae bacterium]|nr:DUF3108 domain-containing protein [Balneolaceae bacterium]
MDKHFRLVATVCTLTWLAFGAITATAQQIPGDPVDESVTTPRTIEDLVKLQETFRYRVDYGFITVGDVVVEGRVHSQAEKDTMSTPSDYRLTMTIYGNESIPFVGRREVRFTSLFDLENQNELIERRFWRDDLHDGDLERTAIEFDHEVDSVRFYDRGELESVLPLVQPAVGGSLVFYASRLAAGYQEPYSLNVFIENEQADLDAATQEPAKPRSVPALEGEVKAWFSEGTTNIKGPFGFSGGFKSWFTTAPERVPLEAWVKIFVGNVKIKLLSYERNPVSDERGTKSLPTTSQTTIPSH